MFHFENLTVKNFMSVGNQTQAVKFDKDPLTLVLGHNVDLGGDDTGSRNGTGKTTIINAISYGLFGQALTNIKKENLINKINGKNMLITLSWTHQNTKYKVERGRKPNILKFFINDTEQDFGDKDDDSQGDSRDTQKFIEQCIGMSHLMFKHILALNTYTEPFLSMKAGDQREIIEQLLGITVLSEKSESLKLMIKDNKDQITEENFKINAVKGSNENIQKTINSLQLKSNAWNTKQEKDLLSITTSIETLEALDVDDELAKHALLKTWLESNSKITALQKQKSNYETAVSQAERSVTKYEREVAKLANNKCPQCEQKLSQGQHGHLIDDANKNLKEAEEYFSSIQKSLDDTVAEIASIANIGPRPVTFYDTEAEAYNHRNDLQNLENLLITKSEEKNPFEDQIVELKNTALQEISYDKINDLTRSKEHQEFLLKLLTNKDSFIRKKIIDQNLTYLNSRLSYYIGKLGLPHAVVFQNDLSVEITNFGQELDFDNLSRGERNRLILAMSFAFRDVWEGLYQPINLLFIDELIDSGMDSAGVEAGLSLLKAMARERSKRIFLVSHKEELIGRVNTVLKVVKENGFTSYSNSAEHIET